MDSAILLEKLCVLINIHLRCKMDRYSSRNVSINDFREWESNSLLRLTPKFQRRSVWPDKARSYLIDTVLRELPMPKLFMRQEIDDSGRTIREIVDGQQRIRTTLSYLDDGFPVMHVHGGDEFGGKYYSNLDNETQRKFLDYEFSVDLLIGASEPEVLDIFARLNTYGVRLNKQELINAKYFGYFKTTIYHLGYEFYNFWVDNNILSENEIARMSEAELTSELIIAMIAGIQPRRGIESYYKQYDDEFPEQGMVIEKFKQSMDIIGEVIGERLDDSHFNSKHLFYSLFCAIYDLLYGLPETTYRRIEFNRSNISKIENILTDIDYIFEKEPDDIVGRERIFYDASTKHTTDLSARQNRHRFIVEKIINSIHQ